MGTPTGRPGERGVALLVVLVVLFIVAVLMVDITLTATTARRSAENASSEFLMDAAIEGRMQIALAQLQYDQKENKVDSLDDRWAREEYTRVEGTFEREERENPEGNGRRRGGGAGEEEEEDDDGYDEEGVRTLGDSDEVSIEARIEDEERKFNLNLLMHPDKDKRKEARERFAVLLDRYREDTPLDLSRTAAEELRDRVVEYLERAAPAEGEKGKIPVAKAGPWRILTPDELKSVEGFEDRGEGWSAELILYDAREPSEVAAYMEDPESVEPPEVYPGLLRFVTLWSGGAWLGQPTPDAWARININTAEKPVLETLFWRNPSDFSLVDAILEYRGAEKEGSTSGEEEIEVDEPLPVHQVFESVDDLKKVDGIDDTVLQRNKIDGSVATVTSSTFSLDFLAERDRSYKQVRFVVVRNAEGFQTLLREQRADPRFDDRTEEEEE